MLIRIRDPGSFNPRSGIRDKKSNSGIRDKHSDPQHWYWRSLRDFGDADVLYKFSNKPGAAAAGIARSSQLSSLFLGQAVLPTHHSSNHRPSSQAGKDALVGWFSKAFDLCGLVHSGLPKPFLLASIGQCTEPANYITGSRKTKRGELTESLLLALLKEEGRRIQIRRQQKISEPLPLYCLLANAPLHILTVRYSRHHAPCAQLTGLCVRGFSENCPALTNRNCHCRERPVRRG
jgi:hypothetical protein